VDSKEFQKQSVVNQPEISFGPPIVPVNVDVPIETNGSKCEDAPRDRNKNDVYQVPKVVNVFKPMVILLHFIDIFLGIIRKAAIERIPSPVVIVSVTICVIKLISVNWVIVPVSVCSILPVLYERVNYVL
jgi:hypothetical protein